VVNTLWGTYLPGYLASPLMYVGIYYFAIMSYLIIIFPIIDIVRLANRRYSFLPKGQNAYNNIGFNTTIFLGIGLIAILVYGTWSSRSTYVKAYEVNIGKNLKQQDLNIALISDIHLGDYMDIKRLKALVSEVNELKPDIVLIAGDLVDSSIRPFVKNEMAKEVGNLKSRFGTYFAFGNHDLGEKSEELAKLLKAEGVKVLKDDFELVDNSFYVVGRDDVAVSRTGGKRKDLKDIISTVDKSKPIILIEHNPKSLKEAISEKIDLQVSGHTHKGQFFPYNLFTNRSYDMVYGYETMEDFNIVVSSGFGIWGPPIRIGSRSEIVQINLKGK